MQNDIKVKCNLCGNKIILQFQLNGNLFITNILIFQIDFSWLWPCFMSVCIKCIYVSQFLFCCQFKRGSILISKEPKRISKGLDDDDDNNDEDDVEELERKIRYGNFFKNVCNLVLQLCDYCWVH